MAILRNAILVHLSLHFAKQINCAFVFNLFKNGNREDTSHKTCTGPSITLNVCHSDQIYNHFRVKTSDSLPQIS